MHPFLFLSGGVANGAGMGLSKVGVEALGKIFGEDVGKEVSKLILHTSGRVLAGSVTVVLGGATMLYDIYKVNTELAELSKMGEKGADEIRNIAAELEKSLLDLIGEEREPNAKGDEGGSEEEGESEDIVSNGDHPSKISTTDSS